MARQCPVGICDGSGIIYDEVARSASFCGCRDQVIAARRARGLAGVIPRRYREVSFDRAPIVNMYEPLVRRIRAYVRELDANLAAGRGLWLLGPVGTGKTTLLMLVSRAALDAGASVAVYSLPRLLSEIRATYEDGSERSYTDLVDRLAAVDLLHIDDVGAEKTSPWVLEQLYAIVNARYEAERAIVLSTNLEQREELAEQVGERTVSRLEEMCEVLPVMGEDARRQRFGEVA